MGNSDPVPFRTAAEQSAGTSLNTTFTTMYRIAEFSTELDFLANHDSASLNGMPAYLSNNQVFIYFIGYLEFMT